MGRLDEAMVGAGIDPSTPTLDQLAPLDEFHVGGRAATIDLFSHLGLGEGMRVLDVGCGLGGPARFCASTNRCNVVGIDLTPSYVAAAVELTRRVGLSESVEIHVGSAFDPPFAKRSFDAAYMLHVGMNIGDKTGLFAGIHRLLRPGARFGIYDLARDDIGDLTFPMPWATTADTSFVATRASYEQSLASAGFAIEAATNREDLAAAAVAQFDRLSDGPPPPVSLALVMGDTFATKVANLRAALASGVLVPVELIARVAR